MLCFNGNRAFVGIRDRITNKVIHDGQKIQFRKTDRNILDILRKTGLQQKPLVLCDRFLNR